MQSAVCEWCPAGTRRDQFLCRAATRSQNAQGTTATPPPRDPTLLWETHKMIAIIRILYRAAVDSVYFATGSQDGRRPDGSAGLDGLEQAVELISRCWLLDVAAARRSRRDSRVSRSGYENHLVSGLVAWCNTPGGNYSTEHWRFKRHPRTVDHVRRRVSWQPQRAFFYSRKAGAARQTVC